MTKRYEFASGMRGKFAEEYRRRGNVVAVDVDAVGKIIAWAPLVDFPWSGQRLDFSSHMAIVPAADYSGYEEFSYVVAGEDRQRCREIGHWLRIAQDSEDRSSLGEKVNAFLVSLWVVRPTMTHIPFYFGETQSGTKAFWRLLDRVQWIRSQARPDLNENHLRKVQSAFDDLIAIYKARGRLRNALVLTFRASAARDWQVGFVCFAAAAEAILNYSNSRGVTDRLARSYAKLVGDSAKSRRMAESRFRRLYRIRSDIVHGRAHDRKQRAQNLKDLASFSNLMRQLWRVVIGDKVLRGALDGEDSDRERALALSRSSGG